jgi:hypothetical protein
MLLHGKEKGHVPDSELPAASSRSQAMAPTASAAYGPTWDRAFIDVLT